eukprot:Protomagalhaensia_sp_Gyna_25__4206@NODE_381_length_3645_cov_15_393511_g292_i0_p2_GENE_NODE_381_length_3645_cov_15_393511_g292_i0NODE_381_length_3645_cov_15_393511_g292_i0_p2_ORF_typecomplete_len357_score54_62DnaJ/PF00226_31/0_00034_NODE_381_length_3645_cov_15_393511_g292_i022763346
MEVWAGLNAFVSRRIDDLKKQTTQLVNPTQATDANEREDQDALTLPELLQLTDQQQPFPLFYHTPRDCNNVALLLGKPTLNQVLQQLPPTVADLLHTHAVAVAVSPLEHGLAHAFWPPKLWDSRPLPQVPDVSRGLTQSAHLKLIPVPHSRCLRTDVACRTLKALHLDTDIGNSTTEEPPSRLQVMPVEVKTNFSESHQIRGGKLVDYRETGDTSDHENTTSSPEDLLLSGEEDHIVSAARGFVSAQAAWNAGSSLGNSVDDTLKLKLDAWSLTTDHQIKDIRILLTTLDTVLPLELGWQSPTLGDFLRDPSTLKRYYRKAILLVHPDKVPADNPRHKYTADRIFVALHKSFSTLK